MDLEHLREFLDSAQDRSKAGLRPQLKHSNTLGDRRIEPKHLAEIMIQCHKSSAFLNAFPKQQLVIASFEALQPNRADVVAIGPQKLRRAVPEIFV
jgi:hypothetical protein